MQAYTDINALKQQMREEQKKRRTEFPEKKKEKAARAIAEHFIGNMPLRKSDHIAGYWPIAGELDVRLLLESLIEEGHTCALPVVQEEGRPLKFRQYEVGMELNHRLRFNTYEPPQTASEMIPTIIMVPLLAFDKLGYRLGFGEGYYDRTLEKLRKNNDILAVGMAYSFQKVKMVPHTEHDQKMDCVVTEKGVVICE